MSLTPDALALVARSAREEVARTQAAYRAGLASYDELAAVAQRFTTAFYAYQVAKVGKRKARRVPYQSVIR